MSNIIIGGGITGLYLAYRLTNNDINSANYITILEKTSRLGGRIHTHIMNEHVMDIGAARFNLNHNLLIKLLEELGLENHIIKIPNKKHYYINGHYFKSDRKLLEHFNIDRHTSIKTLWEEIYELVDIYGKEYLSKFTIGKFIQVHFGI